MSNVRVTAPGVSTRRSQPIVAWVPFDWRIVIVRFGKSAPTTWPSVSVARRSIALMDTAR